MTKTPPVIYIEIKLNTSTLLKLSISLNSKIVLWLIICVFNCSVSLIKYHYYIIIIVIIIIIRFIIVSLFSLCVHLKKSLFSVISRSCDVINLFHFLVKYYTYSYIVCLVYLTGKSREITYNFSPNEKHLRYIYYVFTFKYIFFIIHINLT